MQRAKASPEIADLIAGDWLFRTGRRADAFALVRKLTATTQNANVRAEALSELVVWDLIQGNRAEAAKDSAQIPNGATTPSVFIARLAAMPSASANEWRERVEKMVPPTMGPLRSLALGYALLLDGKRDAARPVW